MQIRFYGQHNCQELADSLLGILMLFKQRYGISNFRDLALSISLLDENGNDVELVDGVTAEVLNLFEIYKSAEAINSSLKPTSKNPKTKTKVKNTHLHLVVDNTKK